MKRTAFAMLLLSFLPGFAAAAEIYTHFPRQIHADQKYLIYSHGLIVEGDNPRPHHPSFGYYEFDAIKSTLASRINANLIAEHRASDTPIADYSAKLTAWVKTLISKGVAPAHITLMGFSRGGELTAFASNELSELGINTILLATCWKGSVQDKTEITFGGHFLSVFETTDGARSCNPLAERSTALASFTEVAITTGKQHGAFFTPLDAWVEPVTHWLDSRWE